MAEETIDKLKVEIEAESKDAGQSLDNFTTVLGKMKNVLEGMKVENLSSLKSSLKELGSFKFTGSINEMEKLNKQMNDLTTKTAKKMSSDLINSFTVTDKNVQASIESICEAFVKFNKVAMMEDYSPDSMANYRKSLQELTDVVTKNARDLDASVAAAERYKEFYDYFRSAGPLMVSREQIAGMNPDDWEYYRKAFPGELAVDTTKAKEELDSFYSDVSKQGSGVFQDLFQGFDYSSAASDQLAQIKSITDEYAKALEGIPYSAEDQKEIIRPDVLSTLGDYVYNYEKQMEEIAGDKSVSEILKFDEENTDISGLKDAVDVLRQLNSVLKNPPDSNSFEITAANIKNLCDAAKGAVDIKTLAEGLSSLFAVIQNVPKSDTFKTVAHDLGTLSNIDASNLSDIGTALGSIAQAVSGTENMSTFASSLANVAETVSEIGDVSGLESSSENISEMGEVSKEAGESMQQASKDISTFRDIVENPIEAEDTSLDSTVDSLAQSASETAKSLDGVSDEFGGLFKNNSAAIEETRDNLEDVIASINEYRTVVNGMETNKIPFDTEEYEDAKTSLSALTRLLDQYKRSLTQSLDISEGPGEFLAESSEEGDNALQNLLASIREYKAIVSGMESGRMIFNEEDYTAAVRGLAQANTELKAFKASFSDTSVESERLDKEIEKATQSLNDLVDKEERFNATGGNTQSSQYKGLQYDIEKAKNKLQELINKQQELSGESVSSAGMESYDKIVEEGALAINRATAAMQNFNQTSDNGSGSLSRLGGILSGTVNSSFSVLSSIASGAHSAINAVASAASRVGSAATSAAKGLSKMVAEAMGLNKLPSLIKKVNSSMDTLNSKITRFTRLFTMMGVRKAYTAIFNDLGDAFEHLAQKSDSVNAHISTLMSAMSQLSHSVAALASPLLDIFGPALTYIINLLNTAVNAVNQFLAAITGKTYYSAKNVATDYAESLEDAASSAGSASAAQDKLNKQLQSFDELNNLTTSQSSGSGSGSGSGTDLEDCYEELEIAEEILAFVDKIKEAWEAADFTEIGNILGEKLNDALNAIDWDKIQETAEKIAKSLATLINGFVETSGLDETLGYTLGQAINTAVLAIDTFITETHWDSIGTFVANGLTSAIKTIDWAGLGKTLADWVSAKFEFVESFAATFDWASLGTSITTGINSALKNINWSSFKNAAVNVGQGIATALNNACTTDLFSNLASAIANGLNAAIAGVSAFLNDANFAVIVSNICYGIKRFTEQFSFKDIGTSLANALNKVISGISWSDLEESARNIASEIAQAINNFCTRDTFESLGSVLAGVINTAIAGVSQLLNDANFVVIASNIAYGLKKFINKLDWESLGQVIGKILNAAVQFVSTLISGFSWTDLKNALEEFFTGLAESLDFGDFAKVIVEALAVVIGVNVVAGLASSSVKSASKTLGNAILNVIGTGINNGYVILGLAMVAAYSAAAIYAANKIAEDFTDPLLASEELEAAWASSDLNFAVGLVVTGIDTSLLSEEDYVLDIAGQIIEIYNEHGANTEGLVVADLAGYITEIVGEDKDLTVDDVIALIDDFITQQTVVDIPEAHVEGLDIDDVDRNVSLDGTITALINGTKDPVDCIGTIAELTFGADVSEEKVQGLTGIVEYLESTGQLTLENVRAAVEAYAELVEVYDGDLDYKQRTIETVGRIAETYTDKGADEINDLIAHVSEIIDDDGTIEDITAEVIKWIYGEDLNPEATAEVTDYDTSGAGTLNLDAQANVNNVEVDDNAEGLGPGGRVGLEGDLEIVDIDKPDERVEVEGEMVDVDVPESVDDEVLVPGQIDEWSWEAPGDSVQFEGEVDQDSWTIEPYPGLLQFNGEGVIDGTSYSPNFKTPEINSNATFTSYTDKLKEAGIDVTANMQKLNVPNSLMTIDGMSANINKVASSGNPVLGPIGATINETTKYGNPVLAQIGATISETTKYGNPILGQIGATVSDVSQYGKVTLAQIGATVSSVSQYGNVTLGQIAATIAKVSQSGSPTLEKIAATVSSVSQSGSPTLKKIAATVSSLSKSGSPSLSSIKATVSSVSKSGSPSLSNIGATINSISKSSSVSSLSLSSLKGYISSIAAQKGSTLSLSGSVSVSGSAAKLSFATVKNGGIFRNGVYFSIPQYAGGTVNTGSLFVAGEAGAELVGHINGQTEVLNESQLAAVMKSSIIGGISALLPSLQAIYSQMAVCANGVIGAELISADTFAELENQQANLCKPDMGSGYGFTTAEKNQMEQKLDDKTDRMLLLLSQIANGLDEGLEVDVELDGDSNRIFRVVQDEARAYKKRTGNTAFAI